MATLPSATTTIIATAIAVATGFKTICVIAPVPTNADAVPRLYGNANAIYSYHGYSEAVEYAALHAEQTGQPILFCGVPIATAGALSREDTTGNTGTCVTTLAAGGSGVLTEHEGILKVATGGGGTIGTSQIKLELSLDGGTSYKKVRLGTANSYVIPYVGVTVSFAAGTLVAGDTIHTWQASGPRGDATGWTSARTNLAAQTKGFRTALLIGDLQDSTEAAAFLAQINAYETANERFIFGRASVLDRLPLATMSSTTHRMQSNPNVTFAEVGATGDTITRSAGSWAADGFTTGDILTISGTTSNNGTLAAACTVTSATIITLDTDDLVDEGPISNVTIVGEASLTFVASTDVVTRSSGSWVTDGFRVGDSVTISGTASNNGTFTVAGVTAAALDLGDGLADEVIGITSATISAGQTKAVWMAAIDAAFATIDDAERISLSAGRGRVLSPFSQWNFRRPAAWFASLREYQHDIHIAPWRKSDGPVGADIYDSDGNLAEWDDYVDGSAGSAARFTTLRSYSNGPRGAHLALDLTRKGDGSLLSYTHNMSVVNAIQTTVQLTTESLIGAGVTKNADGTATTDWLSKAATLVQEAIDKVVASRGEGQRCSKATWTPSADDDFSDPEATLTGVCDITLDGTVHSVYTSLKVN